MFLPPSLHLPPPSTTTHPPVLSSSSPFFRLLPPSSAFFRLLPPSSATSRYHIIHFSPSFRHLFPTFRPSPRLGHHRKFSIPLHATTFLTVYD
ncbi:MAG: hypothetical protein GX899_00575 [Rikenellaceae bacterium]|nr:hypothetical protein [Rikenellaceae bacterium]